MAFTHQRDICVRSFSFACEVVRLSDRLLRRCGVCRLLAEQLAAAGTSVGANVEEAQAGQTKPDFIAKTCVALKEARESFFWLRLIEATVKPMQEEIRPLRAEASQLVAILTAIVVKACSSSRRGPGPG